MEQFSLRLLPENQIYSVRELNASIRAALESEFRDVRVAGEISGTRLATSGHCYFTLKELDSAVKCVCYRSAYRYLKVKPQDGIAVVVRGQVGVFEARGEYQIQVEGLEAQGHGVLQLAFEDLKKRLAAEGLFEISRKRVLPTFPTRLGIVTSPKGAVISDILNVLERRFPGLHIRLFPAMVQGEGSVEEVCRGIDYFSNSGWADVMIVARGGGSLEDLWTFNTEPVARAIATSHIPVISAVGHETDVTIADFVADVRAPTPSAAAEILCTTRLDLLQRIGGFESQLRQIAQYRLATAANHLQRQGVDRLAALLIRSIGRQLQSIDDREYRLKDRSRGVILGSRARLHELDDRLRRFVQRPAIERGWGRLEKLRSSITQEIQLTLMKKRQRLESSIAAVEQLSPVRILGRGYALVSAADGSLIKQASDAAVGSDLRVRLAVGVIEAKVTGHHSE